MTVYVFLPRRDLFNFYIANLLDSHFSDPTISTYRLESSRLRLRKKRERESGKTHESLEKWLVQDILFVTHQLERKYQDVFLDISKQLGITLRSEEICRKVLFEICSEILITDTTPKPNEAERRSSHMETTNSTTTTRNLSNGDTIKLTTLHHPPTTARGRNTIDWVIPTIGDDEHRKLEITWGRVCAIIVVAANLASESVRQGHGDLVDSIVDSCVDFAYSEEIGKWVEAQGGWQKLRHLTRVGRMSASSYAVDHHRLASVYNMVFASLIAVCIICSTLVFIANLIR